MVEIGDSNNMANKVIDIMEHGSYYQIDNSSILKYDANVIAKRIFNYVSN